MSVNNRSKAELINEINQLHKKIASLENKLNEDRLFKQMFDNHPSVKLLIDPIANGQIINANKAACQYYGYSLEEIKQLSIYNINILPIDQINKEMQRALEGKQNYFQFEHQLKSGEIRSVEAYSSRVDRDGKALLLSVIYDITDRKRAENRLQKNEYLLRTFLDSMRDIVILKDENHRYLLINETYRKFLKNQTYEMIIGKTDFDVLPQELAEQCLESDKQALENNNLFIVEEVIDNRIFESSKFPVELDNKKTGIGVIIREITETKRMEKELIESQKLYKTLIDNIPDCDVYLYDKDLRYLIVGGTEMEKLGFSPDHFNGKTLYETLEKTLVKQLEPVYKKALTGEKSLKEIQYKNYHYLLTSVPIYDNNGNIIGGMILARNTTERKKYEQALKENEIFLNHTGRMAKVGGWSLDVKANKTQWTNETYNIYERPKGKLPTMEEALSYFHPEDKPIIEAAMNETIEKAIPFNLELRFITHKGNEIWTQTICEPEVVNGKVVKLHGTFQDITERKYYEQDLQKALERAQRADKLKSTFLANMSHEIRTPLNGILGFVELMIDDEVLTTGYKENLQYIKKSGKHLLELINNILELSKIEAGETTIHYTQMDLKTEIYMCLSTANYLLSSHNKQVELKLNMDPDIPETIHADPLRMKQVINNLISNAVKFTNKGTIEISVELKDNNRLEFKIKDTGIGIEQHKLEDIFKPFRQEDESISIKYGGTGLGLSITRKLIELMGGTIQAASKKGKGTTFTFSIPFLKVETKQKTFQDSTKSKALTKTTHILIVEDEETNQIILKELLTKHGFDCIIATNGWEALKKFRYNKKIDLILMDIRMTKMDGIEATDRIKKVIKQENRRSIPIFALTAAAMPEDIDRGKEVGFDEYITKPFNWRELLKLIHKHL